MKPSISFLLIMLLFLLTSCGITEKKVESNSIPSVEQSGNKAVDVEQPVQPAPNTPDIEETAFAKNNGKYGILDLNRTPDSDKTDNASVSFDDAGGTYAFYDKTVKEEIGKFFQKDSNALTMEDILSLSDFTAFEFLHGDIEVLNDLPELFPNLRYFSLGLYGNAKLSPNNCKILESMSNLRGFSIYTNGIDSIDSMEFSKQLDYVDIQYSEEAYSSESNNLLEITLLGEEFWQNRLKGNIKEYIRATESGWVYELLCTDYDNNLDTMSPLEVGYEAKLLILEKDGEAYHILDLLDVPGRIGNASGGLILADVDFDGEDDILVKRGHLGNQGFVTYTCFLKQKNKYILNDEFSRILNPSLDEKNKKILSAWRNWAASHSWAMYSFVDGVFVQTDQLTEEPCDDSTEDWVHNAIKNIGTEFVVSNVYCTKDYSKEEYQSLIYADGSYWGLGTDKWLTLNNQGSYYSANSIYASTSIDAQVAKIIDY